jgi:hypothetical protein
MTEHVSPVPNTRSPGTPICHPNDAYLTGLSRVREHFHQAAIDGHCA